GEGSARSIASSLLDRERHDARRQCCGREQCAASEEKIVLLHKSRIPLRLQISVSCERACEQAALTLRARQRAAITPARPYKVKYPQPIYRSFANIWVDCDITWKRQNAAFGH